MGDFFASILGGQNKTLNNDILQTGQQATFDTGEGQSDVSAGDQFLKSILSGDATKQAQVLAPEISAEKKAAQNDAKTQAMTAGRTGGTAATSAANADKVHGDITDMIARLTGTAATALPSIGTTLTGQGTEATSENAAEGEQRMKNWQDSVLGQGITGAADYAESFAPVPKG